MISIRWVRIFFLYAVLIAGLCGSARAQSDVDTMVLVPQEPDSFYVERKGSNIIIGWYPPADSISKVLGSRDYTNWYGVHTEGDGVDITFSGNYSKGWIDRQVLVEKFERETHEIGVSESIVMRVSAVDMFDRTYEKLFDLGTDEYTPGDPVELTLIQLGLPPGTPPVLLELGFNLHFSAGLIDTSQYGPAASFAFDIQDFEGFHIWRGWGEEVYELGDSLNNKVVDISKYPSEQEVIVEISKEDYFKVSTANGIEEVSGQWKWLWEYFNDNVEPAWPRQDDQGRWYYEWVDKNVYGGITYHYNVTTFDRGYFRGFTTHNKTDNFVCDEDSSLNAWPGGSYVQCDSMVISFEMTVDTGSDINRIYTVPNPYRTGTSEETTPYYHNYDDMTIKFFNMPREATIKIYTVAGDLVWEGSYYNADGRDGILSWNVKNKNGLDVGSGVYVYRVESATGEDMYGRIVVIR